ncbi:RloB domain-containing protein [Acidiferrobacter thiooxydans]|uniref:RloB domain-containing protein n=1 Tax=Acidiferrobacter thiooxydans TaxID=163359 RepID=A0A368HJX9_9GAMM|nr:RloB domain-containing protein [Acidiferrobacter thiooxydans]
MVCGKGCRAVLSFLLVARLFAPQGGSPGARLPKRTLWRDPLRWPSGGVRRGATADFPRAEPRSFRRRPGHKAPRSITLIVCEGETEQEYFKALRMHYGLTTAEIVIAEDTKGSTPISVVNYAEEKAREPGGYDRIYCVFDRDHHESFERAREKIRDLASRQKRPLPIKQGSDFDPLL